MSIDKEKKTEIISNFSRGDADTGSPEVQVAILTGTDIIDHMRMIELKSDENNSLLLDKDYETRFNSTIKDMLSNVQRQSSEEQVSER